MTCCLLNTPSILAEKENHVAPPDRMEPLFSLKIMIFGSFFIGFGLLQCLLLSLFFYRLRLYRIRSGSLAFAFLYLSLVFAFSLAYHLGYAELYPHMSRVGFSLGALIGPIFAIAIRRYFGYPRDKFGEILGFLIPCTIFIYSLPYYLSPVAEKLQFIREDTISSHPECDQMSVFTILGNLILFGRVYFRIRAFQEEFPKDVMEEFVSFQNYLRLSFVFFLLFFFVFLFLPGLRLDTFTNFSIAIWVIGFAWMRVYSESFATPKSFLSSTSSPSANNEEKYKKNYLSQELVEEYGERIQSKLVSEELYLDSEFDLGRLAQELGTNLHTVSQVINRYFEKSFLELIRDLRIQKSKKLLETTTHPILRVGLDAGFNSKTSFLRAFREEVGLTPSEYRKNHPNSPRT